MRRRRHKDDDHVARLRAGDDAAWSELYTELAGPIRGYARSKGAVDPDDLTGDVFAAAAERIASFDGDRAHLRSWLFTIAHHRLADSHRRRRRRATDAVAPETFDDLSEGGDDVEDVVERLDSEGALALLELLTDDQRDVLVLRVLGGLSIAETSDVLGRAEGAVKALQHRAVNRLKRALGAGPYLRGLPDDDRGDA